MKSIDIEQVLKESEFFKNFDDTVIKKISKLGRVRSLKAGDHVFRQGDFGEHIYIIIDGYIVLERSTDLGHRSGSVVIDMLGKGRFLGCWSTILAEPHILMSSAYCQKPTKVVAIRGTELREIMLSNTALGFSVLERLCFLLRDRVQAAYGALERI
jgi:CRP/FNR family transcriptional regulator, cyclic AMP receptor protein